MLRDEYKHEYQIKPQTIMIDDSLTIQHQITLKTIEDLVKQDFLIFMDFIKPATKRPDLIQIGGQSMPFVPTIRKGNIRVVVHEPPKEEAKEEAKKFSKENSVFKPWTEDTFMTINKCIENDIKYWKVPKICKDKNDYAQVIEHLR